MRTILILAMLGAIGCEGASAAPPAASSPAIAGAPQPELAPIRCAINTTPCSVSINSYGLGLVDGIGRGTETTILVAPSDRGHWVGYPRAGGEAELTHAGDYCAMVGAVKWTETASAWRLDVVLFCPDGPLANYPISQTFAGALPLF